MSVNSEGKKLLVLQEPAPRHSKEKHVVKAEAESRLQGSGYPELYTLACDFYEGVLTLRGRVSTFYLKQVAQTVIRNLDGVEEINNRLEVAAQSSAAACPSIATGKRPR